jgi:hypothetical protein
MSTSQIPVYYENQLCGSISLAEFMKQPRYGGSSIIELMSESKKVLLVLRYATASDAEVRYHPKFSGSTKKSLLWNILLAYWDAAGMIEWELAALHEIKRVYLS